MDESDTPSPICLLTDFGIADNYVGVMKGVIQSIAPGAPMIDLTHDIAPQNVSEGRFLLEKSISYFPPKTVFLCVVDPGVGTDRRGLAISGSEKFFVGPDNGLFSDRFRKSDAVVLQNPDYRLPSLSNTFHGRDLFAPTAAHLSRGLPISNLGPSCSDPIILESSVPMKNETGWIAQVQYTDHFGNLVTSFSIEEFLPQLRSGEFRVETEGGVHWPFVTTYGEVPPSERCSVFGGFASLELSLNLGNAAVETSLKTGDPVYLRKC